MTKWGSKGSGPSQFGDLVGIAVGLSGQVYTLDAADSRVTEYSADGWLMQQWGSLGSGDGQFEGPYAIAVGPEDQVYVSDNNNDRIEVFTADGHYVTQWQIADVGYVNDIGVDWLGSVYVLDHARDWVRVYEPISAVRDTTPPVTTVSGVDKQWHNRPVTLSFSATDAGGSGVAFTEVRLQDWLLSIWEPWARVEAGKFVVPASADHSDDGDRLLEYRSVDRAGIVEAAKQVTVLIDSRAPSVKVQPATATQNKRVVVKFRAQDQMSPDLRFEGSVFRESENPAANTASVHYASSAWLPRKKLHTWSFTCRLEPGKYSVYIWARDRAGNEDVGKAALTVKKDQDLRPRRGSRALGSRTHLGQRDLRGQATGRPGSRGAGADPGPS